jgi:hypothetical protein
MPQKTITILLEKAIVEAVGFYTPFEKSYDDLTPDSSSYFELYEVLYMGVDIRPCLSDEAQIDLEERCLTLIEN